MGRTLLHIACQKRWRPGITWLLEQGADPTITTDLGSLPLHYTAAHSSRSVCRLLLSYQDKLHVSKIDNALHSVLDYARRGENSELVGLLTEDPATRRSTTTDTSDQEDHQDSPQCLAFENPLPPVQLGNAIKMFNDVVFGQQSTTSNMPFIADKLPVILIKALEVIVEHTLGKHMLSIHEVPVITVLEKNLHWQLI
jgi:hypothetical protein